MLFRTHSGKVGMKEDVQYNVVTHQRMKYHAMAPVIRLCRTERG